MATWIPINPSNPPKGENLFYNLGQVVDTTWENIQSAIEMKAKGIDVGPAPTHYLPKDHIKMPSKEKQPELFSISNLSWIEVKKAGCHIADLPNGTRYEIQKNEEGQLFGKCIKAKRIERVNSVVPIQCSKTLKKAKAACQRHWERELQRYLTKHAEKPKSK